MKIVCDSCSTKYSISDDKVRGKVFKIRCKKCSHIIVVKGTSEEGETVAEAPAEAGWHVVIDGEQVGPLIDSELRVRLSRGEISAENYVWKEGFADWQRLADVPDFADLIPATASGELYSEGGAGPGEPASPQPVNPFAGSGGLFGIAGRDAGSSPVAVSAQSFSGSSRISIDEPPSPDAFGPSSSASPAGSENADLFGMATQHSASATASVQADGGRVRARANGAGSGRHDGGRIENLTAQRSDNSVLFSLSNLQSLAAPGASAPRPPSTTTTTEGSGLIDIRAMAAASTASPARPSERFGMGATGASSDEDVSTFAAFSTAAPVLLPLPSNSSAPRWVYAVIGVGAVIALVMIVAAYSILRKPVMVEQVVAPPAPPAPVTAPPGPLPKTGATGATGATGSSGLTAAGADGSKAIAEADLPPRQGGDVVGGDRSGADKAAARGKHPGKARRAAGPGDAKLGGGAAGVAAPASAGAAAAPDSDKPKAAKGSLDDLLEGALKPRSRPKVDDDAPRRPVAAAAEPVGSGPLSKGAVVAGMAAVKAKVMDCYAQFKVPGMAMVNVNIGKNGKVSAASVTGKFAGTPTGACVEKAVKTASFPPSDGLATPYPFNLR